MSYSIIELDRTTENDLHKDLNELGSNNRESLKIIYLSLYLISIDIILPLNIFGLTLIPS